MKRNITYLLLTIIQCLILSQVQAQNPTLFQGKVLDQHKQPIYFATIYVEDLDQKTSTNSSGEFQINFPKTVHSLQIRITVVGKKAITTQISPQLKQTFIMEDLSLTLQEVNVLPEIGRTHSSNSSIVYDEEAIERVQAFSLMDILNTLPGKATTAPTIDAPQTVKLRGNLGGSYDMNNSLGVAIIMDGVRLSNDANMQSRSVSQFGMAGSILGGANNYSGGDVPFQGIDLRDIPVETIERIEVVQGVASAEYDELTDGAIIIDRKAGKSPFSFTTNVSGGSSNFSLSKGLQLNKKLGAINLGLNYAISNPNPRDKVKQYDRVSGSLMWSTKFSKTLRNTLSLDLFKNIDEVKVDPDDNTDQRSYTKSNGIRLSNRLNWALNTALAKNIAVNISYSINHQDSYKQWLLNQSPKGYAYKDTTGIYEGVLLSGRYIAEEQIIGKPVTASGSIKASTNFTTGQFLHALSYGVSLNYSNNGGRGIIADPNKPRWVNLSGQNARPYSFEYLDPLVNYGLYITDNFTTKVAGKKLSSNFGVRVDQQNGSWSLQPRLSTLLKVDKHFDLKAAYGIATKSPTMAHRYPAPTFIDIPLILAYNSEDALYLVYSEKFQADNSKLKPSKSAQFEVGINYRDQFINSSLNIYWKNNSGGFSSSKEYKSFKLPNYNYGFNELSRKMYYEENGTYTNYSNYGNYSLENIQNSKSFGIDWMLNTKPIKGINTSLTMSHSFIRGQEQLDRLEIVYIATPIVIDGENVSHLLFPPSSNDTKSKFMSKFGTNTHIPKLGFVVSTNLDLFWFTKSKSDFADKIQQAVGYVDNQGVQGFFSQATASIPTRDLSLSNSEKSIVYGCLNLSVAKELKKKLRIAVTAYNVLNIQPEQRINSLTNTDEYTIRSYNAAVSITGGLTYKF